METSRQKEIGVVVVAAFSTLITTILVSASVINLEATLGLSTSVVAVVLVWAAIISCASLFLSNWFAGRLTLIITSLVAMFTAGGLTISALVAGSLLALFLFAAQESIVRKAAERLRLQLRYILFPGLSLLIAGFAIAAFALSVPSLREAMRNGQFGISTDVTAAILAPAVPIIGNILPGYTPEATVDELIAAQARQQLGDEVQNLPPEQLVQARRELATSLKVDLNGSETVADIVALYSNDFLRRVTAGNGVMAVIVLATVGLLAIRAAVPLISWLPLILAGALMWISKKTGLVSVSEVQVAAQRLEI